ncbi:MAG TPA: hypothetical protein ENN67_06620 [Firmicutes bacterium]|nr:hypothetical protein [Bacillota bacterium]
MSLTSAYELSNAVEIPLWADRFAFLRRLWLHPLFQVKFRKYTAGFKDRNFSTLTKIFILGVAIFIVLPLFRKPDPDILAIGMTATFTIIGLIFLFQWFECVAFCIVTSAKDYRREDSSGILDLVYTTLLTDRWLFYAIFLPCVARSVRKLEPVLNLAVVMGLIFLAVPFMGILMKEAKPNELAGVVFSILPTVAWIVINLLMILVLGALSVGLYSMMSKSAYSVAAMAYFNVIVIFLISSIFIIFLPNSRMSSGDMIQGMIGTVVFQLSVMTLSIYATGFSAVHAFSKHRRPGYHEDDKATAFDFMIGD